MTATRYVFCFSDTGGGFEREDSLGSECRCCGRLAAPSLGEILDGGGPVGVLIKNWPIWFGTSKNMMSVVI